MTDGPERISFIGGRCPENFRVRTLGLGPGDAIDYRRADWAGALVVVERGEIEVECSDGVRVRFAEGAVLAFAGLTPRRLRNAGSGVLVLSALTRDPSAGRTDSRSDR